jgi:hypothetical protein
MYPADWIWQQYGLCLGWRCSQCKEKVLARSLPFKGLRKRKPDPDEMRDLAEARGGRIEPENRGQPPGAGRKAGGGGQTAGNGRRGAARRG